MSRARASVLPSLVSVAVAALALTVTLAQGARIACKGAESGSVTPTGLLGPLRTTSPSIEAHLGSSGGGGGIEHDHDGDNDGPCECNCGRDKLVRLYRFLNTVTGSTLLTIDQNDPVALGADYTLEETAALVFGSPVPGTSAVFRYYNPATTDHFYTTNPLAEILGDYTFIRVEFYIDVLVRCTGQIPLFRYYNGDAGIHLHYFTVNLGDFGTKCPGYEIEGITGFVKRAPAVQPQP